jgi:hypothetical protein
LEHWWLTFCLACGSIPLERAEGVIMVSARACFDDLGRICYNVVASVVR